MSDFIEWFKSAGEKLLRDDREVFGQSNPGNPSLQTTTVQKQFDNFVRTHFMINTEDYVGLLGTEQAYKSPSSREVFLDNKTTYNERLSNDRIAVYVRGAFSGQDTSSAFRTAFICIHGTKLSSIEDIVQDARLVLPGSRARSSSFTQIIVGDVLRIISSLNLAKDNIYVCGHSLGGYYALLAGYISNTNVRIFNGANELIQPADYSNFLTLNGRAYDLQLMNAYNDAVSYRMFGDPVSLLSKWSLKNTVTIRVDNMSVSPLTLHSLSYMIEVCLPEIPLDKRDFTRRRRFAEPENFGRDGIQKEGGNLDDLTRTTSILPRIYL